LAIAELTAKLEAAATKSPPQAEADIKALAEKYGLDEGILADIIATARAGIKTEIPQEVQDLIAQNKQNAKQQAETKAFENRVSKLAATFKDEQIAQHKDKLLELAYSTEKAPDGEPYYKKELAELYFGHIKGSWILTRQATEQ
jgi:cell pole-organizing protein PopZ